MWVDVSTIGRVPAGIIEHLRFEVVWPRKRYLLVSCSDHTSHEENGLVNLFLGPITGMW